MSGQQNELMHYLTFTPHLRYYYSNCVVRIKFEAIIGEKRPYHVLIIGLLTIFLGTSLCAQQKLSALGQPLFKTYDHYHFGLSNKIIEIENGPHGKLYFANQDGLLVFDGYHWHEIGDMVVQGAISSIEKLDERIYISGQGGLGYFDLKGHEKFKFYCLNELFEEKLGDTPEASQLVACEDELFINTNHGVYSYRGDSLTLVQRKAAIKLFTLNDHVLILNKTSIKKYQKGSLSKLIKFEQYENISPNFILPINDDNILIGDETYGILKYENGKLSTWNEKWNKVYSRAVVTCGLILNNNHLALGSIHKGLFITDFEGNTEKFINESNGLADHNILALYKDRLQNLWVSTDNGVTYLETNSPFSLLGKKSGLRGNVHTISSHNGYLYIGTDRGLYYLNLSGKSQRGVFQVMSKTSGVCWNLTKWNNQLFLAHSKGLFQITNGEAEYVSNRTVWDLKWSINSKNLLYAGTDKGIDIYKWNNGSPAFYGKLDSFNKVTKNLFVDSKDNIWVNEDGVGIHRISTGATSGSVDAVTLFNQSDGLPNNRNNTILSLNDHELRVGTKRGVYKFDESDKSFIVCPKFNKIIGNPTYVRQIFEGPQNRYISINNQINKEEIGVFNIFSDDSFARGSQVFNKLRGLLVAGEESVHFQKDGSILFGTQYGVVAYDPKKQVSNKPMNHQVMFSYMESSDSKDIKFVKNDNAQFQALEMGSTGNAKLHFCSTFPEPSDYTEFSTYIDKVDQEWKEWSTENFRDLSSLKPGNYTIWARSRNIYNAESPSAFLKFNIPESTIQESSIEPMIFGFLIFAFLLIYLIIGQVKNATLIKKIKLVESTLFESERISKVEKSQLSTIADSLKKQLESAHIFISNIEEGVKNNVHTSRLIQMFERFKDSKSALIMHTKMYEEDELDNFSKILMEKFPALTPRELKICGYLKLNLTSKEIAEYMGISIRGVESLRYRMRKKMGIAQKVSLTEHILNLARIHNPNAA